MTSNLNSAYLQLLWYPILPQFLTFFLVLFVFGGERRQKEGKREKSSDSFGSHLLERGVAAFMAVSVLFVLLVSAYAMYDVTKRIVNVPQEPDSDFPLPIKDQADAYPQGPGSLLRFFALNYYDLEDTTVEDEEDLQEDLIDLLNDNKSSHTFFLLPEGFLIHEATPCSDFKTVESIAEYDEQIIDAWEKATDTTRVDRAYQYHRVGVSALNCLDILSGQCRENQHLYRELWDDFMYYGELAVWALANEYVYGSPTDAGKVDLFYRIAQAYEHVGMAATDEDPPFQHELYFISAAFLELSFRSLENINFEDRGQEYRSAVWDLYMKIHFCMGEYVKAHSGFFEKMTDCSSTVEAGSQLTEAERSGIQEHLDDLAEWKLFHRA